jgi:predicted DNA binding CopG/RHH family protein
MRNRRTKKTGIYKDFLQVRIPYRLKSLVKQKASEKNMTIAEYIRFLLRKELENEEL